MNPSTILDQSQDMSRTCSLPRILILAFAALAVITSGCHSRNIVAEKGRDNYFGGHGQGVGIKHYVPREVQRVEPQVPLF
jgi:hypothetical protein